MGKDEGTRQCDMRGKEERTGKTSKYEKRPKGRRGKTGMEIGKRGDKMRKDKTKGRMRG